MADGVTITSGANSTPPDGTVVSTDDAGASGQVQRVKLAMSADGSATHIPADADGLLVNLGANNDVTVSGTVSVTEPVSVDDNAGSLTVDNPILSVVGGGTEAAAQRVTIATDSTGVVSVDDNGGSLTVDGTVGVSGTVAVTQSGTWDEVGINDSGNSITVDDGGASLTVDGAVSAAGDVAHDGIDSGNPVKIGGKANSSAPTEVANGDRVDAWYNRRGSQTVTLRDGAGNEPTTLNWASDTVAAGNVTALAISAEMYIADGTDAIRAPGTSANGLDVDVTRLPALPAGTNNIGDVDIVTVPAPLSTTGGGTEATAQRVTIASDSTGVLSVDDNGASLTVDGTVTAAGGAAHGSPVSGNPNLVAGRASNAVPTDVGADGDAASMWTNRHGAQMVSTAPHVGLNSDPWNLVHEGAQYTSAQTSTVLVAGGASEKIVVTKVQIQAFATTAGTAILYFGTGAYSRGTNRAIFDGEFAPSATLKPGAILDGPFIAGTNGDDLLVTTTNALSITFSVWYYVVT